MADLPAVATNPRGRTLLSWTFPEFVRYERKRGWYIWAIAFGAGLLLYALLTRNFLFAVIVVMVAVIFVLRTNREPRLLTVEIKEDGVQVSDAFFPYKELKNFWIAYDPPGVKKLYVEFDSTVRPTLSVDLQQQNPLRVRQILLAHLPEDLSKEDELLSDRLARLFKL